MTTRTVEGTALNIDRATHTIRFERTLDASPAEAFDAWTKPEEVTHWWDPSGAPLVSCDIDLKPGGAFKFVTDGHGSMPFTGRYVEIKPGERLVFEAMGATGTVAFNGAGERTKLVVEIACPTAEHLEQFLKVGVDEGTARTLHKLDAWLSRSKADA